MEEITAAIESLRVDNVDIMYLDFAKTFDNVPY